MSPNQRIEEITSKVADYKKQVASLEEQKKKKISHTRDWHELHNKVRDIKQEISRLEDELRSLNTSFQPGLFN